VQAAIAVADSRPPREASVGGRWTGRHRRRGHDQRAHRRDLRGRSRPCRARPL